MNNQPECKVPPLTHEERRQLIDTPFICHIYKGRSWGGATQYKDFFRRTPGAREDESPGYRCEQD